MITVLDKQVADKIAAGEVVERPVSIVKELLENAIDAEAGQIVCEIRRGGRTYLRLSDDGCGIAREEAETAFLRHATSKIRRVEDLSRLTSLGFRGEALASIAAVARVEMLTKPHEQKTGTRLLIEGGTVVEKGAVGCPDGTTIIVRDLFYNTPARAKFLKSDSAETALITSLVSGIAMAYPQLRIRLISNGRILFSTRGSGDRLQTIAAVDGSERTRHLLPVQADERGLSLRGYISDLEESRSTRRYQTYFVNGRAVDSKVMERAVSQAYGNRLPHGRSPIVYLFLHVDPAVLDVNIHPNKRQVRFDDEVTITAFIRNAVAAALTVPDAMPSVQVEAEKLPGRAQGEQLSLGGRGAGRGRGGRALRRDAVAAAPNPQGRSDSDAGTVRDAEREHVNGAAAAQGPSGSANAPDRDSPRNEETAASQQDSPQHEPDPAAAPGPGGTQEAQPASSLQGSPQGEADAVAAALDAYRSERDGAAALHDPETPYAGTAGAGESMRFSDLEIRGAAFNTYIIAEREDRLYLIDQHAAHERVNFERLMRQLETADGASQLLLLPQTVEVSFSDEERLEPLRQIGYRLEEFGPHTWRVREIPAQMEEAEADAFLREYLDGAGEEDDWHSRTLLEKAAMRACKASVKAHDRLSEAEIRRLLHDLDRCRQPFSCPHGRPTCVLLSRQEIEKRFGRT